MTDSDLFEFSSVFADVRRVFPLRADDVETRQLTNAYFQAFRRQPLSRIRSGAESWIAHGKRFPKPAEWLDAIPSAQVIDTTPELTTDEADVWLAAERQRWEGDPCRCLSCQQAQVTHRPIRFVPEFDANDRDVKARLGDRTVTRGHWAHGDELARWYVAKEAFYGKFRALVAKHAMTKKQKKRVPFQQRIDDIFKPKPIPEPEPIREPGEEG